MTIKCELEVECNFDNIPHAVGCIECLIDPPALIVLFTLVTMIEGLIFVQALIVLVQVPVDVSTLHLGDCLRMKGS